MPKRLQSTNRSEDGLEIREVSLGMVSIGDRDADGLRYSLVGGNEAGLFRLDEHTGELFFIGLNRTMPDGTTDFELLVRASDGTRSEDQRIVVSITGTPDADVTDADATGADTMESDTVQETAQPGSYRRRISLGTLFDPVPPGVPAHYRLVEGNEAGLFELDARTGELFFTGSADDLDTDGAGIDLHIRLDSLLH